MHGDLFHWLKLLQRLIFNLKIPLPASLHATTHNLNCLSSFGDCQSCLILETHIQNSITNIPDGKCDDIDERGCQDASRIVQVFDEWSPARPLPFGEDDGECEFVDRRGAGEVDAVVDG